MTGAALAYAPPRHPAAKLRRRMTQWQTARPARLRFAQPVLSICFDDFPKSAAQTGADILEAFGARGSFYASAGLAGADSPCGPGFDADDLKRLAAARHEIGCHTFSHQDCARMSAYDALSDIARNRDALTALGHHAEIASLAYPYGETSTALKAALPPRFACARGVLKGLNVGRTDLAHLRANALFGADAGRRVAALMRRAAKSKAWLILFTHDVAETPSPWGSTPALLRDALEAARAAGFAIAPVREAARMGGAP